MRTRGFEIVSKYNSETIIIKPRRATLKSAGYDIFNNTGSTIIIYAGQTSEAIPTKIKSYMLDDEYLSIKMRSSHGFKYSARLANVEGIIDSDYYNNPKNEGEIFLKIRSPYLDLVIMPGEAMCQAIFRKYLLSDDDNETVGGERLGGIGSTNS